MAMNGSFYIDTTKIPVHLYEEALRRHIYSPTEIVHVVCGLAGWSLPKYHTISYSPTGILCSVTVNGQEIRSEHPGRNWKSAVNKASAHFLNFLEFTMDLREQTGFYYWKHPPRKLAELRYDLDMRIRDFMGRSSSQRDAQQDKHSTCEVTYERSESSIEKDPLSDLGESPHETSQSGAQEDKHSTCDMAYEQGESPIELDSPSNYADSLHEMSQRGEHYGKHSTSEMTYERDESPIEVDPLSDFGDSPHETSQSGTQQDIHSTFEVTNERGESPIGLDSPSNRADNPLKMSQCDSQHGEHSTSEVTCERSESPTEVNSPSNRANILLKTSPLSNVCVHGTRKRACSIDSPKRVLRRRLEGQSSKPEAASSHVRNKPSKNLKGTPDASKKTCKKNTFISKCRQKSVVRLQRKPKSKQEK